MEPSNSLPLPARLLLLGAVAALGFVTLFAWTGGIGRLVGSFGASVSAILGSVGVTATPTPPPAVVSRSPLVASPAEPYTNQATVELQVTVPTAMAGQPDTRIRIYLALQGQPAAPIKEAGVGPTPKVVVPVDLTAGRNDFTATVISPGGESEPSPVVTYILDTEPPLIALAAPSSGATVNASTIDLVGKVQARTRLIARNNSNGSTATGTAGADGSFKLTIPLAIGSNALTINATDPAGNPGIADLTVIRGSGVLAVAFSASTNRISIKTLPRPITLVALVTDPDGKPLRGAVVTFSLTLPKIPAITYEARTEADGEVTFSTTVPKGIDVGGGLATVLVNTNNYGQATNRVVITIVE